MIMYLACVSLFFIAIAISDFQKDMKPMARFVMILPAACISGWLLYLVITLIDYMIFQENILWNLVLIRKSGFRLLSLENTNKVIELLMEKFGYTVNSKGYKVLPNFVRVIQGDGITYQTIAKILRLMEQKKLSASNIAFGQGAGLLQKVDRDTMKFAMKASAICVNGEWRDVYKDPTGQNDKKSKRGRLALVGGGRTLVTIREREILSEADNELRVVWENGKLLVDDDFETIRERSNA